MDAIERTALYRLFGAKERLLYVGVASDPLKRWAQHAKQASWWPEVLATRIEWFDSRANAEVAEVAAIAGERPVHNLRSATYRGVGVEEARKNLGRLLIAADERGVSTVITVHGRPEGVLVGPEWYRQAREALDDPTDL